MKKLLPILLVIIVAATAAYFLVFREESATNTAAPEMSETAGLDGEVTAVESDAGGSEKFTAAQVAEHNSANDCWTIINDKVYNLTSYIPRHPGGDEILRACGTDGTSLFETRTTADGQTIGGGGSHSGSAEAALNELRIGSLED